MYRLLVVFVVFTLGVGMGQSSIATITRVDAMDFGTFALKNNASQHNMSVSRTNIVTADSAYVRIIDPTRGEYALTDFPISTVLTFSIPDTTMSLNGSGVGEIFSLENFTPPPSVTTNGSGAATLLFGATLRTSGSGSMYPDGNYSGLVDITVNY